MESYSETLTRDKLNPAAGVALTLGMAASILAIVFVCAFIAFLTKYSLIRFLALPAVALLGYWFIKKFLTAYIYIVDSGALIIERKIGRGEKEIDRIPLRSITRICTYPKFAEDHKAKHMAKYTFLSKKKTYVMICKNKTVLFSPSPELLKVLKRGGDKD